MQAVKRNIPASVRQLLRNHSARTQEAGSKCPHSFCPGTLMYRLGRSHYADRFLVKGSMLFVAWKENAPHRLTRDLDLLGFTAAGEEEVAEAFRRLSAMEVDPDDAVIFDDSTIRIHNIRADKDFNGIRLNMIAILDTARIPVQVDVGFGGAVTPGPEIMIYPTILPSLPPPVVYVYPVYTVVAEKVHATVKHGMENTRMRDFYDLWFLGRKFKLDSRVLRHALQQTFAHQNTPWPPGPLVAFTPEFAAAKAPLWQRFLSQSRLREPAGSWAGLIEEIRAFLAPVL